MQIIIKRLNNPNNGQETGAILYVNVKQPITPYQKMHIEDALTQYAFHQLYPNQGLNLYSEVNSDTPSIVAIKNIDNLPEETDDISLKQ